MLKTIKHTCSSALDGDTKAAVIQLGFVPTRVTIKNRTALASLEWTDNTDTFGYKTITDGTMSFLSACALTVIDGSDKQNYTSYSYGFLMPEIADINDTAGEILDITAERTDL